MNARVNTFSSEVLNFAYCTLSLVSSQWNIVDARMLNDGCLIYSVNEVKATSARRRISYTVVANRRRYIGRNFGSNRRNRAGRFKPADLALSEGDHAKFSRISMSTTSGYYEVLREILPLNDGLLCLPLSLLLWLSPPTSVTSFPVSSLFYSSMILRIYSSIY